MKRVGLGLGVGVMIAVAIWAYNVNYETRQAFDRLSDLRGDIAAEGEAVQVLRVEWAWLNAPHRLQSLVRRHDNDLGLVRLDPDRFGFAANVPFPPAEPFNLNEAILAAGEIVAPGVDLPGSSAPQPVARPLRRPDTQQISLTNQ